MSSILKEFYDKLYYGNPSVFGTSSLAFLEKIVNTLSPIAGQALDIGTGEGLTSIFLAKQGFNVDAVDISNKAFTQNEETYNINFHHTSISNFEFVHNNYCLINLALIVHHISEEEFITTVKKLQENTADQGLHVFRLFTKNSDFYKHSKNTNFYDDGTALNELYKNWEIIFDEIEMSKAATQTAKNEIRNVVFKKTQTSKSKVIPN